MIRALPHLLPLHRRLQAKAFRLRVFSRARLHQSFRSRHPWRAALQQLRRRSCICQGQTSQPLSPRTHSQFHRRRPHRRPQPSPSVLLSLPLLLLLAQLWRRPKLAQKVGPKLAQSMRRSTRRPSQLAAQCRHLSRPARPPQQPQQQPWMHPRAWTRLQRLRQRPRRPQLRLRSPARSQPLLRPHRCPQMLSLVVLQLHPRNLALQGVAHPQQQPHLPMLRRRKLRRRWLGKTPGSRKCRSSGMR